MNREQILNRWEAWRKHIAEGGKGSCPRDEFEAVLDELEENYRYIRITMEHARIFISSRQKMNDTGIELYDDLLGRLKALEYKERH